LRHGNSLATIRYRMSDGLNFVVVDEVEVESSHSRTSNRCSFDKLRAWPDRPRFNGYKVVFVPFSGGRPSGKAEDVVTGFLNSDEKARGRPVGLAVDKSGALLIADDVGNAVWRVTPAGQ
jgi:glucose/arabinose dehydrogenase